MFLFKVLLHYIIVLVLFTIVGIGLIFGVGDGRTIPKTLLGIAVIFLALYTSFPAILDLTFKDYEESIIAVKKIQKPHRKWVWESKVKTERSGTYRSMFNSADVHSGETYKITYLKRTKIIIHSRRIDDFSALNNAASPAWEDKLLIAPL